MKTAYINGIILNGEKDMEPRRGMVIFTEGDRISSIEPEGVSTEGCEVIDLNGSYIMPGLINMHVHIPSSGRPKKKQSDVKKLVRLVTANALMRKISYKMCVDYIKPELYSGVTTIRSMGGILDYDARLRDDIAAGRTVGPRIVASNMAVSVPGGHMAGSLAHEAHSAEEAAELTRQVVQTRPDVIKLMITGGVLDARKKGEPGELKMPAEYVKAACDEAHRSGLKVAAHVESAEGIKVALKNGVDTIEHGAEPDDEILALFKAKGAAHVATISPALPFALFDRSIIGATEEQQYNGRIVFEGIINCAKACLENGIPVGLGTDTGCPYITQYDMWRELYYFAKYCGVSNCFALYTGTLGNAKILGLEEEIGSIAPGKCADMIVTRENPLEDLSALRNVNMVVSRGKVVDISGLKKFEAVERELDKFID